MPASFLYPALAAAGLAALLGVQTLRLGTAEAERDAVRAKFGEYIAQQISAVAERDATESRTRQESADAWAKNLESIRASLTTAEGRAEAFRRAAAADRYRLADDRVRLTLPAAPGDRAAALPAAPQPDAAGAGAIPAAAGTAAARCETSFDAMRLCLAEAAGQCNVLQTDIEAQVRY